MRMQVGLEGCLRKQRSAGGPDEVRRDPDEPLRSGRQELGLQPTQQHEMGSLGVTDRLARGTSERFAGGFPAVAKAQHLAALALGVHNLTFSGGEPTIVRRWGCWWRIVNVGLIHPLRWRSRGGCRAFGNKSVRTVARVGSRPGAELEDDDVSPPVPRLSREAAGPGAGGASLATTRRSMSASTLNRPPPKTATTRARTPSARFNW